MTTLISVHNSEGCVGRCDAKCHNATDNVCTCICGGLNHGVGGKKAIENTKEMLCGQLNISREQLDKFIAANNLPTTEGYKTEVNLTKVNQFALPM